MRPRASNKKTVSKPCPECDRQNAVACKTCTCGYQFYIKKGDIVSSSGQAGTEAPPPSVAKESFPTIQVLPGRRRTERVKRERPKYFNALEYASPTSRRRRNTSTSQSSGTEELARRKRGRPRATMKAKEELTEGTKCNSDKDVDVYANVPIEKVMQYAVILAEINRKYSLQCFRP